MEKLGDSFRENKEFVVKFIEERFGVNLGSTEILPIVKYPEIAARAEGETVGRLRMGVSRVIMRLMENSYGAGIAGYGTVFYSQAPVQLTLSDKNMFQILAHEFGHILTEKVIGKDWVNDMSYELSDGFADYIAREALSEKFPGNTEWYGENINLHTFEQMLKESRIEKGSDILVFLRTKSKNYSSPKEILSNSGNS